MLKATCITSHCVAYSSKAVLQVVALGQLNMCMY